jgi:anti-sigma factor RsiW
MNTPAPELERLISRYLDDEATRAERRQLEAWMRRDPEVEALVDEYAGLDREIGLVMRTALGRPARTTLLRSRCAWVTQAAAFAAAAGLALAVWMTPGQPGAPRTGAVPARAGAGASWFAPVSLPRDSIREVPPAFERPQVRLRDTNRDWIIIPADEPGQFLLIEVDRVRLRAIHIEQDF